MWFPPNLERAGLSKCQKVFQIAFWISALVLLVMCLILAIQPSYWRFVLGGSLTMIVGSGGSQLLPEWKHSGWLRWARAVCIGTVVAGGGLATTYGWNMRSTYNRDLEAVKYVAAQWKVNDSRNEGIELIHRQVRERDFSVVSFFPIPEDWQMTLPILTLRKGSSRLPEICLEYSERIDYLCTRLNKMNDVEVGTSKETYRKMVEGTFGRGDAYPRYIDVHNRLERVLREEYPGVLEEVPLKEGHWQLRPDKYDNGKSAVPTGK